MDETSIQILLVDDHPVVRDGYRLLLENTPGLEVIAEADSGEAGYQAFQEYAPDVVIMDLTMPGMGGLEAMRRILKRDPGAKVLIYSVHESAIFLDRARKAGAVGYVPKRCASKVVIDAVRCVAGGENYYVWPESTAVKDVEHPTEVLTPREFEVFRLLAEGSDVAKVAETLHISPNTAGVHQTRILSKLRVTNLAQLARLAIRSNVIEP